jgi:hypothetical protein
MARKLKKKFDQTHKDIYRLAYLNAESVFQNEIESLKKRLKYQAAVIATADYTDIVIKKAIKILRKQHEYGIANKIQLILNKNIEQISDNLANIR